MYFLGADIGGTNARLALFEEESNKISNSYKIIDIVEEPSQKSNSFPALLEKIFAKNKLFHYTNIKKCVLAVTGVQHGVHSTNGSLPFIIDKNEVHRHFSNFPEIVLINDFAAQAMACTTAIANDFIPLFNTEKTSKAYPLIIMGVGTGLGSACVGKINDSFFLLPSEGGHQAFPFYVKSKFECDFAYYLCRKKKLQYPSVDSVLSGSGLAQLNSFITNQRTHPKEITEEALAFTYFARFLARALRNYALTMMPHTIVLSGGILAKHQHIFTDDFYKEFLDAPRFKEELSQIQIFLNKNEHAALYGTTCYF